MFRGVCGDVSAGGSANTVHHQWVEADSGKAVTQAAKKKGKEHVSSSELIWFMAPEALESQKQAWAQLGAGQEVSSRLLVSFSN